MTTSIRLGRNARDARRHNPTDGIRDLDQPQRRSAIPLAELAVEFARWNYRQDRAKDAYYRRSKEKR